MENYSSQKWHFRKKRIGDTMVEPKSLEKFDDAPRGVNKEAALSFFVTGESYQNDLDASLKNNKPVKCKIDIKEYENSDKFLKYFDDVKKHTIIKNNDKQSDYQCDPKIFNQKKIKSLIISDYNTTGITGDVELMQPVLSNGEPNNWFGFFHSLGKSVKKNESGTGGSEGEGRQVFAYSSLISTFFVYSVDHNTNKHKFMGMSYLGSHWEYENEYLPLAKFGKIKNEEDLNKAIDVPITEANELKEIKNIFEIDRDSSGTTIVVPFIRDDINKKDLIVQSINRYRYAINNGDIELEICGENINKDNLHKKINEFIEENPEKLIEYLKFLDKIKLKDFVEYKANTDPKTASLTSENVTKEDLVNIKKDYEEEKIICLKVPVTIKEKVNQNTIDSFFKLYISKTVPYSGNDEIVRDTMPLYSERKLVDKNSFGLCLIEETKLTSFIRDAEGANHLKLVERRSKLVKNYESPQFLIRLIRNSLLSLETIILENPEETDFSSLKDFFNMVDENTEKKKKKKRKGGGVIKVTPRPKRYKIDVINKKGSYGLKVSGLELKKQKYPYKMRIYVAYEVENTSNAFSAYDERDFDISSFDYLRNGDCNVIECNQNKIVLEVGSHNFSFSITGFVLEKKIVLRTVIDPIKDL